MPAASAPSALKVVLVTPDEAFADCVRAAFATGTQISLEVIKDSLSAAASIDLGEAPLLIADLDKAEEAELHALERLSARHRSPIVAVADSFDEIVARRLIRMRVADFVVKPVPAVELVRTCARVVEAPPDAEKTEAQIFTFLPAVGGAGVTTLAVQTAMLLLNSGSRAKTATCLVDLDFQHGACRSEER